MKELKLFSLMLMLFAFCVTSTSCSSDDDEPEIPTYADYYVECTSVNGGGFTTGECRELMYMLNEDLHDQVLEGMERDEAIEIFDEFMNEYARELSGIQPLETLYIGFALKTISGTSIKTATVTISKNGSSVSRANEGYTITIE